MHSGIHKRWLVSAVLFVLAFHAGTASAARPAASQALLDALPQPVGSLDATIGLFTWQSHPAYDLGGQGAGSLGSASAVATAYQGTPAGLLAAALKRVERAKAEVLAAMNRQATQSMAALPPGMQDIANNPQAQAAMRDKLANMSEQQKMAYAMQMQQQIMQTQMQREQAMAQNAGEPTEADDRALHEVQNAISRIAERRAQATSHYMQSVAGLDGLEKQWAKGHDAIEAAASREIRKIPYERGYESGGGCYGPAVARRVRRIEQEYADRQVVQAGRDLAQARQWATGLREQLLPAAREDDEMMGYYADLHNAMMRQQVRGNVLEIHSATITQYFQAYVDAVRDAELQAARWLHARRLLDEQPLETCT